MACKFHAASSLNMNFLALGPRSLSLSLYTFLSSNMIPERLTTSMNKPYQPGCLTISRIRMLIQFYGQNKLRREAVRILG